MTNELKPFLEDMLSMSTGVDGRTLQIHFCRPVTADDRKAIMDAHNAAGYLQRFQHPRGTAEAPRRAGREAVVTRPSDVDIRNAIDYALRRHPVEESADSDEGECVMQITDPNALTPFVMCLLEELKVLPDQ